MIGEAALRHEAAKPGQDSPIGIFDSGVGGLTVARAIRDQLPDERMVYIGDTQYSPYGPRPIAQVRELAIGIMDHLVASGVKMLVIACNTASAATLRDARERYDVPVVEVIVPAARRAAKATRNGKVGVIGTLATITSGAYQDALAVAPGIEVYAEATPRFVDFVERGVTAGRQLLGLAQGYLQPLQDAGVDTLILGCTHYPLLTGVLGWVMGDGVTLVSSAEETAKDVFRTLVGADLLRPDSAGVGELSQDPGATADEEPARDGHTSAHRDRSVASEVGGPPAGAANELWCTGDRDQFARVGERFFGPAARDVRHLRMTGVPTFATIG